MKIMIYPSKGKLPVSYISESLFNPGQLVKWDGREPIATLTESQNGDMVISGRNGVLKEKFDASTGKWVRYRDGMYPEFSGEARSSETFERFKNDRKDMFLSGRLDTTIEDTTIETPRYETPRYDYLKSTPVGNYEEAQRKRLRRWEEELRKLKKWSLF